MAAEEVWKVYTKRADFHEIGKLFHVDPVIARVIRNRDHETLEDIEAYLHGDMSKLHPANLFKDMDKAVEIIVRAIAEKKKIRVIGDYDIDGVCAGYILTDGLRSLGADVDFDVPERLTDGYGINERLIKQSYDDGVDLIVTCDNGIAARDQIDFAKSLGMQIIVTDHHEVPFVENEGKKIYLVPKADAVVNHKQMDCPYPFKELCGASVAMKVVSQVYDYMKERSEWLEKQGCMVSKQKAFQVSYDIWMKKYYVFASVATIGDVVSLTGENRILVKYGLKTIKEVDNYGLQALIDVCQLREKEISSYSIGFVIGPCINAGGRLETARKAFSLFCSQNAEEAHEKASELKEINETRKKMTMEYTHKAIEAVENSEELRKDKVLVVYLPDCHESLAGIIAGRIREEYNKPTFVLTDSENGVKGSGRSIEEYSMFEKLVLANTVSGCLTKFGGHPMAAGLSLEQKNIELFRKTLNDTCGLDDEMIKRKVWIDVPMPFGYISENLVEQLSMLEPFGKDNEKPVFADKIVKITRIDVRGQNRNVISMYVVNERGETMKATIFEEEENFRKKLRSKYTEEEIDALLQNRKSDVRLNIIYYPKINEFRGNRYLEVVINKYS